MPHVHMEMIGGLAGDMFLAAALDAGLIPTAEVEQTLSLIGLGSITLHREVVTRYGIRASHVRFSGWGPEHEADHRHLTEIEAMLRASALPEPVKARAIAMFRILGQAESEIHDIPLDHVHFHEIGAVDSLLDFVAAALIIERLDATWSIDHVPAGRGVIQTEHGVVPALAPATARLLLGFELTARDLEAELVTPTGATILRALAAARQAPSGRLLADGYGAGTKDFATMANVVRLTVYDVQTSAGHTPGHTHHDTQNDQGGDKGGAASAHALPRETILRLSCELDDMTPEALGFACEQLLAQGALDVVCSPVHMKKWRAGVQLAVLAKPQDEHHLLTLILTHTSTLGVRVERVERVALARQIVTAQTPYGPVRVKRSTLPLRDAEHGAARGAEHDAARGAEPGLKAAPEYEDCAALARAHGLRLEDVMAMARLAIAAPPEQET